MTGYEVVFALTAAIGIVGGLVSLALRNYRFHADGTRLGEASGAPGPASPLAPAVEPAAPPVSATSRGPG